MWIKVERDYESMSQTGAEIVAEVVRRKPNAVLGLATGSTPLGLYRRLIQLAQALEVDFHRVTTFNLDEYEGLAANHPQSYRAFMWEHLFQGLGLRDEQVHFLDGTARDLAAECSRFEEQIRRAGGIDIQVLGIGSDGHIAFCEPGSSLASRTSLVALHPQTIADNARFFAGTEHVPRRALSMGTGTILESRCCLILANGAHKADAWAGMIEGPVSAWLPASALQLHPWVIAVSDEAAASKLKQLDYYCLVDRALSDQPILPPWIEHPERDPRRRPLSGA